MVAPFGPTPPDTTAASTPTTLSYSGLVEIVVSGDGVSARNPDECYSRNDAFYLFSGCDGSPSGSPYFFDAVHQLAIDTTRIQGGGYITGVTPYAQLAKNLLVFDIDGQSQVTPVYVPPYRADNTYRFVIDLSLTAGWSGVPSVIHFGVADGVFADNVGNYNVSVYQLAEAPPGDAVLLQAVPYGSGTRVAVSVSGGDADTTLDVELVSSSTCSDGTLDDATAWGSSGAPVNLSIPLDDQGDGFVITDVEPIDPNTYAAARAPGSISGPSGCIVAGPDNDSWTRAADILLTNVVGEPAVGDASGFIDDVGTTRWFKLQIVPGARATIELFGLPADYDLTVFKDITQAFAELAGATDVKALNQLGAEFAPSAFTPSAFTPSAFTPSAFTPSAFTPSAFTPSAFTPSVFTPSAFTPSAFTPSAFTPSAFTPSAFTPSAFTPSAFTPSAFTDENFSSAQTRSLIAASAQTGTATERVTVDTWNNTGDFYIRVSGKNGASSLEQPFQLGVELDGELCNGVAPLAAPTPVIAMYGDYESIILYDSSQLMNDGYSFDQLAPLEARLDQLAARPEVNGVVVDLGTEVDIQVLHAQADEASSCPYAANLTAEAIKRVIDAYRIAGNPLKHVVLAGSDGHIPFFRYPDQGLLGPEQDYEPPMANDTQSQSSLRLNYVLGQDEYGAETLLSLNDGRFPVPGLSVGRLVETVPEMITVLDAYLATPDGVVSPSSTLVTGYDFLTDAADAIQEELVAGTNGDGRVAARNDTLITNSDVAPSFACTSEHNRECSWTASQLRSELLDQGEDLIFLAGHFSANNTLAADYLTTAGVTDLAASGVDLVNSVIFAAGCHSGYNIVNGDAVPNVTLPLDWTQAFAQKGATLVAGTGYQYGDTDFIEYSERLYLQFAKELRTGTEPVSVGEALVRAKQHYLKTTPDLRGLHRKSVLISTVFGLPMLRVDLNRESPPSDGSSVMPYPVATGTPGDTLGLEEASFSLTFGNEISLETVPLKSVEGCSDPDDLSTCPTILATYLRGPDEVVTNPYEPALPLQSVDVSVSDRSLRGVGFRGGNWSESPVIPLTGAPAYEIRGVHTPFASLLNYPMRMAIPNYYGAISQNQETILHLTPAQHRVPFIGSTEATLRRFSSLDYQLYYSNNTASYGDNVPALAGPPTLSQVEAEVIGADVHFTVIAVGAPAAGMQSVWVTYTEGNESSGTWESMELEQSDADSRVWRGALTSGSSGYERLDFMVQAVNGVGLVSRDDNFGAYYQIQGNVVPPAQKLATTLALSGTSGSWLPDSVPLGAALGVEAMLTDEQGNLVDGAPVEFTVGGTTRVAVTENGYANVDLPLNVTPPGEVVVIASFRGDEQLLASSAQQALEIEKAQPVLTLTLGPQIVGVDNVASGVTALLEDESGAPMPNKWVYFTLYGGPDGMITKPAQTNNVGVADLGDLQLPEQSYPLEVRYLGEVPIPGQFELLVIDSPLYYPAETSSTLSLIGGENCPTADVTSKVELVRFCYLVHKVKGKVQITDGTLIVGGASEIIDMEGEATETTGGTIDNKIDQYGAGSVIIHPLAQVKGKIVENGPGGIRVLGYTSNKLAEHGPGDVEVAASGIVDGKIDEFDGGSIFVLGSVGDGLKESGEGGISIADSASATGETVESGPGSVDVSGDLYGNATEQDAGDLVITATGTIDGDAIESGDGSLFNDGTVTGSVLQD